MADIKTEKELQEFLKSNPDKLIGLSKGLGIIHAKLFNSWSEIPHDTYRLGIYFNNKPAIALKSWAKKEIKIQNYVGCE